MIEAILSATLLYNTENIFIKFNDTTPEDQKQLIIQNMGGTIRHEYLLVPNLYLITVPAGQEKTINGEDKVFVQYITPDIIVHAASPPNDHFFQYQTNMTFVDMLSAWNVTTGNSNVKIAVLDTGIFNHLDIRSNLWVNEGEIPNNEEDDDNNGYTDDVNGWNFFDHNNDLMDHYAHGTHVAGIIGAMTNNEIGVAGINWQCSIMNCKFMGDQGWGYLSGAIEALEYAVYNGATISNNSWAGIAFDENEWIPMGEAIEASQEYNHLFIAAAGNNHHRNNDLPFPSQPSSFTLENVIAVSSVNYNAEISSFSNYGPVSVDVAAPGEQVLSLFFNGGYTEDSGTSMACPHVAGVAGLVRAIRPDYNYQQIKYSILNHTTEYEQLLPMIATGGVLNAGKVLRFVLCPADTNGDGGVDIQDLLLFLDMYSDGNRLSDINSDGGIGIEDLLLFLQHFDAGC